MSTTSGCTFRLRSDLAAGRDRAGEDHLVDARVDERSTSRATTGHHLEEIARQAARLEDLLRLERG